MWRHFCGHGMCADVELLFFDRVGCTCGSKQSPDFLGDECAAIFSSSFGRLGEVVENSIGLVVVVVELFEGRVGGGCRGGVEVTVFVGVFVNVATVIEGTVSSKER